METFRKEGKDFWKKFGEDLLEMPPRCFFDYVSEETYRKVLEKYNLEGKTVLDLGAGFPPPLKGSLEKEAAPLASELQEILEEKGAKIIAVDVASFPLKEQKAQKREAVVGSAFELPFKDNSIDGGVIILNLLNASFKTNGGEIYITPQECETILKEAHRVLKFGQFIIVNNFGYVITKVEGIKIIGPDEKDIISFPKIQQMVTKVGFRNLRIIPLDPQRLKLGEEVSKEAWPEPIRDLIVMEHKESGALIAEK